MTLFCNFFIERPSYNHSALTARVAACDVTGKKQSAGDVMMSLLL